MIDKFNFYDIYGYFLPGAVLLLLFWLPFGLITNKWPGSDWGSAVLAVITSYIAGHLLQMICTRVLPSTVAKGGRQRNPSDFVLDDTDTELSSNFKTNLAEQVKNKFKVDLSIDKTPTPQIDSARNGAFFMARHSLVRTKEVSYAEQFEGLYTLLRNVCGALVLAGTNYIGWSISLWHRGWLDCVVIIVLTAGLLASLNLGAQVLRSDLAGTTSKRLEKLNAGALLLVSCSVGYAMGRHFGIAEMQAAELFLCALAAFAASLRCFGGYRYHCMNFAKTVWRDFSSSVDAAPPDKATAGSDKMDE
jgi:hypothetical protein